MDLINYFNTKFYILINMSFTKQLIKCFILFNYLLCLSINLKLIKKSEQVVRILIILLQALLTLVPFNY